MLASPNRTFRMVVGGLIAVSGSGCASSVVRKPSRFAQQSTRAPDDGDWKSALRGPRIHGPDRTPHSIIALRGLHQPPRKQGPDLAGSRPAAIVGSRPPDEGSLQ
ncbi:MAG: hypothetical protein P4L85_12215 [Paludisphaera borealis]|uniref:hypothetical protein n=1 Tax=Paludisphaera borealis TaxID=1387353 RepID=UPI00284101F5|nr:hypothetical protein [Paludisphaera borealis]MDR3620108.1 hypothetical protein [Paludisphaera borealis]